MSRAELALALRIGRKLTTRLLARVGLDGLPGTEKSCVYEHEEREDRVARELHVLVCWQMDFVVLLMSSTSSSQCL